MRVTVRAISVGWKKPIKCVESRKDLYAYSKHKDLGKLGGGGGGQKSLPIEQPQAAGIQRT